VDCWTMTAGGGSLSAAEKFLRKAEECLWKAYHAHNEVEQAGWLDLADAWFRLSADTAKATQRQN
jgi:hypothetical protein